MLFALIQALISFIFLILSNQNDVCHWSFGYGSNMDRSHVEIKKNLTVLDFQPAVLKGYKMLFNIRGWARFQAFAGIVPNSQAETHGALLCLDEASKKRLDQAEMFYKEGFVQVKTYSGKIFKNVSVYLTPHEDDVKELAPSRRYLNILIRGAKQLGLDPNYVRRLESTPTFIPSEMVLNLRRKIPPVSDLRLISVSELAENKHKWLSVKGYVIDLKSCKFRVHCGRDITSRVLMQFHDIPMDMNDDGGRPPYPLLKRLSEGELDHLDNWLDFYHIKNESASELRPIVGYLKEFREQQESGDTTFKLPPRTKYL